MAVSFQQMTHVPSVVQMSLYTKRLPGFQIYITCGVSAAQLQNVTGKGSSDPVADNSTAAGRQQNRRVEVYLYASQAMVNAANNGTLN